ncbi:MAG TPA: single-stranded-DNA-specific exonuclease RecJ [bacterium]|nr:single-stranded-DNA-specific exonuclease RecJ [bacterium]
MTRWIIKDSPAPDAELRRLITSELSVSDFAADVLALRGISGEGELEKLIQQDTAGLNPPFLFEDMEKAVLRIKKAVDAGEKIVIYGDYDVDGVTAIVILSCFFNKYMGYKNTDYYIPHRQDEGYGLNKEAVKSIAEGGASLLITVDCGISAKEEAEYAVSLGMDIIITDHHLPPEGGLPGAAAVINPKTSKAYPDKDLSGAGVAYKLVSALAEKAGMDLKEDFLDFAALGTVADIVPLSEENRAIVRRGFKRLRNTLNPGLRALKEAAGLAKDVKITTYHAGFILGPRINAAGRLEHARSAVELFLTDDSKKAEETAAALNRINDDRKKQMKAAEEEAVARVAETFNPEEDFVIVVYDGKWNPGIAGLVASRIMNKFYRPVFVLTGGEDGLVHGSARSIKTVNIFDALKSAAGMLERFGGHRLAAGVKLKEENIPDFRTALNDYMKKTHNEDDFKPFIEIDMLLNSPITVRDIRAIELLEPWGEGNPRPVFAMEGVDIIDIKLYKNNTMKFYGKQSRRLFNFILFGYDARDAELVKKGAILDIAFTASVNEWQGDESVCLEVKDIKSRN